MEKIGSGEYALENIDDSVAFATDGEHIFVQDYSRGLLKVSMNESDFGKVLLCNPNFKGTTVSLVHIEGKLYTRDRLQKTVNYKS